LPLWYIQTLHLVCKMNHSLNNRRRTDNTMAKRKKYKSSNNDLHIKLKTEQHDAH
jgi:hypothetical protein